MTAEFAERLAARCAEATTACDVEPDGAPRPA
jgi:hypothetical protein